MKNQTTKKITHSRLISICLTTVMLFGLSFSQMTHAQGRTIVYEYTGRLDAREDFSLVDCAGIDGAQFHWVGTFDADATPSFTNGVNLDRFDGGVISLTLSGATDGDNDGEYFPKFGATSIGESTGGIDSIDFSNTSQFGQLGARLSVGRLEFPPGFTGAVSLTNTLTPFTASDVLDYQIWTVSYLITGNNPSCAFYDVVDGSASGTIIEVFDDGFENPE